MPTLATIISIVQPTSRLVLHACARSEKPLTFADLLIETGATPLTLQKTVQKLRALGYLTQARIDSSAHYLYSLSPEIQR